MIVKLSDFFFFNDTATTEIYPLSLHDALPICFAIPINRARRVAEDLAAHGAVRRPWIGVKLRLPEGPDARAALAAGAVRSEEHTSELQSRQYLVCRLLLEKIKTLYLIMRQLSS